MSVCSSRFVSMGCSLVEKLAVYCCSASFSGVPSATTEGVASFGISRFMTRATKNVRAMLLLGVKGFFVALGFCLCVVAAFCLLSLVAGISNGIAKRLKSKEE